MSNVGNERIRYCVTLSKADTSACFWTSGNDAISVGAATLRSPASRYGGLRPLVNLFSLLRDLSQQPSTPSSTRTTYWYYNSHIVTKCSFLSGLSFGSWQLNMARSLALRLYDTQSLLVLRTRVERWTEQKIIKITPVVLCFELYRVTLSMTQISWQRLF